MVAARHDTGMPRSRCAGVPGFGVREMVEDDLDAVLDIERRTYQFPWSENIFRDCIRVLYRCRIVECEGAIAGYAVMTVAAGEAHVLNLCIDPGLRRRGLGLALLEHLLEEARAADVQTMLLEVRPSNTAAIALYRRLGFERIGRRRDYYPCREGREDALVLSRSIDQ